MGILEEYAEFNRNEKWPSVYQVLFMVLFEYEIVICIVKRCNFGVMMGFLFTPIICSLVFGINGAIDNIKAFGVIKYHC